MFENNEENCEIIKMEYFSESKMDEIRISPTKYNFNAVIKFWPYCFLRYMCSFIRGNMQRYYVF